MFAQEQFPVLSSSFLFLLFCEEYKERKWCEFGCSVASARPCVTVVWTLWVPLCLRGRRWCAEVILIFNILIWFPASNTRLTEYTYNFHCFTYAFLSIAFSQIQSCVFQTSTLRKETRVVNTNIIFNSVNWRLKVVHVWEIRPGFLGLFCTVPYCVVILVCRHIWVVRGPKLQYC